MAELDLRALSARLEALQPDVKAAYARLDAKWVEITQVLRNLSIPGKIAFTYSCDENSEDHCAIEFVKWNGERRLCDVYYGYDTHIGGFRSETTPFEEWSAETRVDLLEHVPALFKVAENEARKFIKRIPR